MYINWVHYYISKMSFILSMISNPVFIYLLINNKNILFGSYRYLLVFFAIFNMFASFADIFIPVSVFCYRYVFVTFIADGQFSKRSDYGEIPVAYRCSFIAGTYGILNIHFVFRYLTLKSNNIINRYFMPHGLILSVIYVIFHISIWALLMYPDSTSNISSKEPTSQELRAIRPKVCSVCGDTANGYHYDVPACNRCKIFFRRTCLSERTSECQANRDCFDLTKRENPIKCRSCRHQKCISVGMNPLAMEIDEIEATSSNFKKLMERTKIKDKEPDDDCQIIKVTSPKPIIKSLNSMEIKVQKTIDILVYLESKVEEFRRSAYNPHWNEFNGLEHLLQLESRIGFADRYGPMPGWPLIKDQLVRPPPSAPGFFLSRQHTHDIKQWFFYNLMTTVEYAKTFMFFHRLHARDKFILTRYVTLACMHLHVSYSTVAKKYEVPINPDGSESHFRDKTHYSAAMMSVAPLIRCKIQSIEYILLKAICLCNPAVPDLSTHAQEILSREREKYADALFNHCLRNRTDAPARFAELIQIFDVLERQQRMRKDLHLLQIKPYLAKLPEDHVIHVIEDIMDS